jgi:putative spermidine/putrescine transport system substrate-binding protein
MSNDEQARRGRWDIMTNKRTSNVRLFGAVVAGAVLITLVLAPAAINHAADSNELTVTLFGGSIEKYFRTHVISPFEKSTGAKVNGVTGLTMENLAKLRASKDNPQLDVVMMDPPGMLPAAQEGLLQPLSVERIPNIKDLMPWVVPENHLYVGWSTGLQCLAYNTKFVKTPPTSWRDLWKPEYKGKVVLPNISLSHGLFFIAIVSQMVTGNNLYDTDAAFKELEKLKPDVPTYWTSHDQAAQLLVSGQAWLTPWVNTRPAYLAKSGAPVDCVMNPKEGSVAFASNIAIPKGAKHLDLAEKYVNLVLSPENQTMAGDEDFDGPVNTKADPKTALAKKFLFAQNTVTLDWSKFIPLQSEWTDRWNRVMVR